METPVWRRRAAVVFLMTGILLPFLKVARKI
jgi:hypothetical protein